MTKKRGSLGRGLSAILGNHSSNETVKEIKNLRITAEESVGNIFTTAK